MSQKFKLIQDRDEDSPAASIQRHISVVVWLTIGSVVVIVILSAISVFAGMAHTASVEREQREAIMTQVAMPTRTPRPTSTPMPPPMVSRATAMRTGPAMRHDTIGTLEAGEPVTIVGRDSISKWYLLDNGYWIEARAVDNAPHDIPFVEP